MASCINTLKDRPAMYGTPLPATPRISFSNDLAGEARPPPRDIVTPDSTFEFAVGVRPMIAADELFFKGRMLPLSSGQLARVTTLRDELRAEGAPQPNGLVRWKKFLGLKRAGSTVGLRPQVTVSLSTHQPPPTPPERSYAGKFSQEAKRRSCDDAGAELKKIG